MSDAFRSGPELRRRRLAEEHQARNPGATFNDALRWADEQIAAQDAETGTPTDVVPTRSRVEDRPWVGDVVHAHQNRDCRAAIVIQGGEGAAAVTILGGEGPDYYASSGHIPYRRRPLDNAGRMSWHWPDRCPFNR